jgi:hypothetical protein
MTEPVSPSPIIETFLRGFEVWLPEDQKAKLKEHKGAIADTTSEGDHARALRCAKWAVEVADDKDATHPRWKQVKEAHKIWKDSMFDAEFGKAMQKNPALKGIGIGDDVRTGWAQDAADVIRKLAEEDGWEKSHWEELLVELINLKG